MHAKEKKKVVVLMFFILCIICIPVVSDARIPNKINYQGKLTDINGDPVDTSSTGPIDITFSIYTVASDGSATWQETQAVEVNNGIFDVILNGEGGPSEQITFDFDQQYWLGIKVGNDNEMTPRQELTSVPFAFKAGEAATAETVVVGAITTVEIADNAVTTEKIVNNTVSSDDVNFNYAGSASKGGPASDLDCAGCVSLTELDFAPGDDGDWTISGNDMYSVVSGNIGIGTPTPNNTLHVFDATSTYHDPVAIFESGTHTRVSVIGPGTSYITGFQFAEPGDPFKGGLLLDETTDNIGLYTNADGSNPRIMIENGGDIGIGTPNPSAKLDVVGTVSMKNVGVFVFRTEINGSSIDAYAGSSTIGIPLILNGVSGAKVFVPTLEVTGGADIAEPFNFLDTENIKAGMVVVIDSEQPGRLKIANKEYDPTVAGIISGANGINPGMTLSQQGTVADGSYPVALTGRVYAWADATENPIKPGDLLTTSSIPGHAMKVADRDRAHGTILGKAMSSLDEGKGLVLVLVSLQ